MADRPEVAVGSAFGSRARDNLHVVCSECGELTDPGGDKHVLQRLAWKHANDVHDGDVDRVGWT